jgi:uncharacterized protein (TIGR02444 family)
VAGDESAGERFWAFSLDLYGRDGVAPACLRLQDRLGADVNVMLFCCWAGSLGRRLSADEIRLAVAAVRPWHDEIVAPIRAARRRLKQGLAGMAPEPAEALRQRLLSVEIEAERIAQFRLAELFPGDNAREAVGADLLAANLRVYLETLSRHLQDADMADIEAILRGWRDNKRA